MKQTNEKQIPPREFAVGAPKSGLANVTTTCKLQHRVALPQADRNPFGRGTRALVRSRVASSLVRAIEVHKSNNFDSHYLLQRRLIIAKAGQREPKKPRAEDRNSSGSKSVAFAAAATLMKCNPREMRPTERTAARACTYQLGKILFMAWARARPRARQCYPMELVGGLRRSTGPLH